MEQAPNKTRTRLSAPFADWRNFLSLLVFFTATALIFRSLSFALIVTASLGFHELGHALALSFSGLRWRISFGLVGAWTWSPLAERVRLSQLRNAAIHLAGPAFSLLLALLALALQALWQPPDQHLLLLANFSAQVGLLNLLPFGSLTDGGKIVRRVIASLEDSSLAKAVLLPFGVTALMLTIYALAQMPAEALTVPLPPSYFLLGLLLVGLWLGSSLFIEARWSAQSGGPAYLLSAKGKSMTPWQVYFLLLLVWDMLVVSLWISAATPFWLAPAYVLGSLQNIHAVIHWVLGLLKMGSSLI